jgi:hypothetical protein
VIVNRKGGRMYKFDDMQVLLMCRISLVLEMSPTCFTKDLVLWHHKKGIVKIDFKEKEIQIPTYPNDEILFFTIYGLALTAQLEICEFDFED